MVEICKVLSHQEDFTDLPADRFSNEQHRVAVARFCQRWLDMEALVPCTGCGTLVDSRDCAQVADVPMTRRAHKPQYFCEGCALAQTPPSDDVELAHA